MVDPTKPKAQYTVKPKPGEMPDFQAAQEEAKQRAIIGTIPAKLAAEGKITPKDKKQTAKEGVTKQLKTLDSLYSYLDELKAIPSTERGVAENISSYVGASGPGQALGRMAGTTEQSVRDRINQMRPLLINNIRQASEMGARGLDSEKELEFYLQAATDPQREIKTNKAALAVLNQAYGLGIDIAADQSAINQLKGEYSGTTTAPGGFKFLGFE